jgi:group I intron endonuclease
MTGIIYKYTSPSNKVYIGQTIHEHVRYMRHKRIEGDNKFHRAIKKYGFENFTYEVIFTIDNEDRKRVKEKLDFMERYYIRKYDSLNNGYNLTAGGEGGSGKHTEEFKKMMSDKMKENNPAWNMTDEWKQHIADSQRGKKMSDNMKQLTSERMKSNNPMKNPEVAAKMAENKKGKHLSEEHKKKISESQKGKVVTDDTKIKMKENATKRHRDSKGHFIKEDKI